MKLVEWVKQHKLVTILVIVIAYLLFRQFSYPRPIPLISPQLGGFDQSTESAVGMAAPDYMPNRTMGKVMPPVGDSYAPAPDVKNRMVVENSYMSLQVKNVRETADAIIKHATGQGGYMVTSQLDNPGESPTGNVVIRVPAAKLQETLTYLRKLSIKVVSENLIGEDVTDQYVDNEARLATLLKTKEKFEAIMDRAVEISDITNIQQQLISLQSQIDAVKGQQNYLEKNAQMAKVTIYLSTDEFSLPYAPDNAWRPEVIFKQAVRSLVENLRGIANGAIWIGVYGVIWIPALLLIWYLARRMGKK